MRLMFNYGRDKELPAGDIDRPMSGIRSAVLGLSVALARRGHDVHLVARCPNPGRHDGVTFHDRSTFARVAATHAPDVLVVVPELLPILMPVATRARVVWTGNAFPDGDAALHIPENTVGDDESLGCRLYRLGWLSPLIDRVVVGSEWHARTLVENLRLPPELIRVSALGVLLDCYRGPGPVRERRRVVYTSQSRRGLKRLLELFPRIRAIVPEAELHIYGYEYNREVTPTDSELFDLRGVVWKGRMRKSDLARELRSAAVLAYPSRFRETFCLAAAEAQAAGLPVVTSDLAALAERVTDGVDGFLIGGRPKKAEYGTAFVERVTQLLSDDELWLRFSAAARRHAFDAYNWDTIAAEWETDLAQLVADRQPGIPATEPTLDLLAPELLISAQRESAIRVPAALAAQSLREEWSSYGYDPATVPGLRPASSSRTARPSVLGTSSA